MRAVSPVALGDGGADLSAFVAAQAASADLGTRGTRQLDLRSLRRSNGGSNGHTAHDERGAKSGDGWAYRGAKHGLRSPCDNCTVQFSSWFIHEVCQSQKSTSFGRIYGSSA